jgi:mono/diheme cytochrome c family protein
LLFLNISMCKLNFYLVMKAMKNFWKTVPLILVAALLSNCTKNTVDTSLLYTPTAADVTTNATLLELQQGRELYINNCSACHGLYSPDSYTATQWKSILNTMAPRTGMVSSDILLVTKYVAKGKQ